MNLTTHATATTVDSGCRLRPAREGDVDRIAGIWHDGWFDGHLGHVPPDLAAYRTLPEFRRRTANRLAHTTVAVVDDEVIGFVVVDDDEIEQLYVAAPFRGRGTSNMLIRHAERAIAGRFDVAWLAVASGNTRARRFYERCGWHDAGAIDYPAEISRGTMSVPCRRYERRIRPAADRPAHDRPAHSQGVA